MYNMLLQESDFKYLRKELEEILPDVETKIYSSVMDEYILTSKSVEGQILKETYILKVAIQGNVFKYEHILKEFDKLENVRRRAWEQYVGWESQQNSKQLNKID